MSILEALLHMDASVDAKWIDKESFLYLSNTSGIYQIWLKEGTETPRQITFLDDRVFEFHMLPNQKDLIFLMDTDGNENTEIYLMKNALAEKPETINLIKNPKAKCLYGGLASDGKTLIYVSNERKIANFDICKLHIETLEKKIIIQNEDNYNFPAGLSPDGKYLLINKLKSVTDNFLWLVDIENATMDKVNQEATEAGFTSPQWKSDNSGFYLLTDLLEEFKYLAYYDMKTRNMESLYKTNWDMEGIFLSPDDRKLAIDINEGGRSVLEILDTETRKKINIPGLPMGVLDGHYIDFSSDSRKVLFTLKKANYPENIWSLDLEADALKRETKSRGKKEMVDRLIEPTLEYYISFDGLEIPFWYYKASDEKKSMLIHIHGGPTSQTKLEFNPVLQEFMHQGIDVIIPNVRGSSGYGKTYHLLDNVEKRLDSVKDIEYLVKHIIEKNLAKADKIAVMGRSYGGYMTLACLAFYPDLWAAGIDVVGIADFETFLENTSVYRRSHRESEYGSLATDREVLKKISPIHKSDEIVAPLMVVHGANDPRVPVSEAEQIAASLENRGIPVEKLIYADEGHMLTKRKNQLDAYSKMVIFLKKHLS